jgi:ribulose-5-phosphate 4-epimerase/fuculose-1-phosphate aldolase
MHIPSLKEVVSGEEWALRCDLAACYRLVAAYGWSDLVFTHISAKLPDSVTGGEHQFLINPYGLMFDEITASSLVKVGVSAQLGGILPISQQSTIVLASLAYHDYEGVAFRPDEKPRLQADLAEANFLVLRNHGLLTVGKTIADAFLSMYTFENTCRIQIDAMAGGSELVPVNPAILAGMGEVLKIATAGQGAQLAWPSLLRKVERLDPGYKL